MDRKALITGVALVALATIRPVGTSATALRGRITERVANYGAVDTGWSMDRVWETVKNAVGEAIIPSAEAQLSTPPYQTPLSVSISATLTTMTSALCSDMLYFYGTVGHTLAIPTGLPANCNWGEVYVGTGTVQHNALSGVTLTGANGTIGPGTIYAGASVSEYPDSTNSFNIFGQAH